MTDKHTAQQAAETTLRAMAAALDARGITVSIDDVDEYNVELFWIENNPEHGGDFVTADTLDKAFIAALHERDGLLSADNVEQVITAFIAALNEQDGS